MKSRSVIIDLTFDGHLAIDLYAHEIIDQLSMVIIYVIWSPEMMIRE